MNILFMIYPVILAILIFWGADFSGLVSPKKCAHPYAAHEDFFVQSKRIKAAACLLIILHHLVQKISVYGQIDKGPINVFNDFGYLFTAIFFFYSGFGLLQSLFSKPGYLASFLRRRLPIVLLPFFIVNILYMLLNRFVYGHREGVIEILKDVFGLQLVNGNGWFIIEITVIYLMFYVIFRLVKSRNAALTLLCVAVLLIIPYALMQGHDADGVKGTWFHGEWWYNSTASFVLGMLYFRFKGAWDGFFKKHYYPALVGTFLLGLVSHFAAVMCLRFLGYYRGNAPGATSAAVITLIVQNADACIFAILVLLLSMRISLESNFLKFISVISLELFLIHGAILELVFRKIDTADGVRFAIVYAVSILVTALVAPVIRFVVKKVIDFLAFLTDDRRNRKKVLLGLLAVILVLAACIGGLLYGERFFFAQQIYEEEIQSIKNAGTGEEVLWGRYDTNPLIPGAERMTWIVVSKKSGVACLLAKEGIDGSYYNQKHEAVTWEESDLHDLINSASYMKMFNNLEMQRMETGAGGDYFSLLTAEEAAAYFKTDEDRELIITAVAKNRGANVNLMSKAHSWDMKEYHTSWWWLRSDEGMSSITAPIVTEDGVIEPDTKYVNKPAGAIRPVIWVRYGI